jgi:asparagine synthetase B (glutamine-hydrolysing)
VHTEIFPKPQEIERADVILKQTRVAVHPGDTAVFLVCQRIFMGNFKTVIVHDGIDELLGGYSDHRFVPVMSEKKKAFLDRWARLEKEHLLPLEMSASHFGIEPIFPYLQSEVVRYISHIPFNKRTKPEESKIPLRSIAQKYLPTAIIERQKSGFCDALKDE